MSTATNPITGRSRQSTIVPPWPLHRFTVAEYQRFIEIGAFGEDDPIELLEGWVVEKMPKTPLHDGTIDVVQALLEAVIPAGWYVRIQNSLVTADSIPEPDLAVVRGSGRDYLRRHPTASEVALVVEVADSSVARDREKRRLYARAGVPIYWIVNLEEACLEIHSEPSGELNDYRQADSLFVGSAAQVAMPDGNKYQVSVAELLPGAARD